MLASRVQNSIAGIDCLSRADTKHRLFGRAPSSTQASVKGRAQGALHTPDADIVEIQPITVLGYQGLNEQVILGNRLEQAFDLEGGGRGVGVAGLGHVSLLGGGLLVNRHPHSRAVRPRSQALSYPG